LRITVIGTKLLSFQLYRLRFLVTLRVEIIAQVSFVSDVDDARVQQNGGLRPKGGVQGLIETGTLSKNVLTLSYPTSDGTMQTIVFKPGSVTEFNAAIGNFQNQKNERDASDTAQKKEKDASDTLSSSLATINEDASQAGPSPGKVSGFVSRHDCGGILLLCRWT
jgi:hypothetical protein